MKKKIAVITATRAEYGLLYWIMKAIQSSEKLELQLIVTGAHLSPHYGNTYQQIEEDGFEINRKVDMLLANDTPAAVTKSMGIGMIVFAQAYEDLKPDLILVLGDRYEILSAVSSAIPFNIPIAHIHGGESTEGAIDEQIRHAITKISHLHFTSTQRYAENVRKLGEEDWRVFFVGAPGLEWLLKVSPLSKEELGNDLNINFNEKVILATFHPVTLELEQTESYIENILQVLVKSDTQVIFTGANADPFGSVINRKLKEYSKNHPKIHYFESLGSKKYLSCQKYSTIMLGNSSSGVIEAASFGLPVVNIGNRQKGRMQSGNVINVGYSKAEIDKAIDVAMSEEFINIAKKVQNVYGDGYVSEKIVEIIEGVDFLKLRLKRLTYE